MQITQTKIKYHLLVLLMALMFAGGLLFMQPGKAQPAPTEIPDASCQPGQPMSQVNGYTPIAQTFTAQNSGQLTSVEVVLNGVGSFILEIRDVDSSGAPSDNVLATTTVNSPSDTPTTITGHFPDPATVVAGQQYAIVIIPPEPFGFGAQYSVNNCPGSLYLGFGTGQQFEEYSQYDLTFAVFVTPVAPTPGPAPGPAPGPTPRPGQPQPGEAAPITQEGEQESEAGEIDQSFEVS